MIAVGARRRLYTKTTVAPAAAAPAAAASSSATLSGRSSSMSAPLPSRVTPRRSSPVPPASSAVEDEVMEGDGVDEEVKDPRTYVKEKTSPDTPSKDERDRHNLTHLPAAAWCPFCTTGKSKEDRHMSSSLTSQEEKRTVDQTPVVQLDYWYADSPWQDGTVSVLAFVDINSGWCECLCVPKGTCAGALSFVKRCLSTVGHTRCIIQTDAEHSITALATVVASNVPNTLTRVAPRSSHASQGSIERKMQLIQSQVRTLVAEVENRAAIKITTQMPLFQSLFVLAP